MDDKFPLLVFPKPRDVKREPRDFGFPIPPEPPPHVKQVQRTRKQISEIKGSLKEYENVLSLHDLGIEPETVLVIEVANRVESFVSALNALGMEWINEWDTDIEPDDDFHFKKNGEKTPKLIPTRMFMSFGNKKSLKEFYSIWEKWSEEKEIERGCTKWGKVFSYVLDIRPWGVLDRLNFSEKLDEWKEVAAKQNSILCHIELFYRKDAKKREEDRQNLKKWLQKFGGSLKSNFYDNEDIACHTVKAELPASKVREAVKNFEESRKLDIALFDFHCIKHIDPPGQSISDYPRTDLDGQEQVSPPVLPDKPDASKEPIAAILDGVPLLNHPALEGRIKLDDYNNFSEEYQPGERRHGTAMASLVTLGDLSSRNIKSLKRMVYLIPVLQPDVSARALDLQVEDHIPENVIVEDRIQIAIERMLEGSDKIEAQASMVKIINFSIAVPKPFFHTPSSLARLLDHLSFKFRLLFCVSVGNDDSPISIDNGVKKFSAFTDEEKIEQAIGAPQKKAKDRRILSPSESINSLSIGASHQDCYDLPIKDIYSDRRVDFLPDHPNLPSPITRLGGGFRQSIKPDVLFPGGRQLYKPPELPQQSSTFKIFPYRIAPGSKVAQDSKTPSKRGEHEYTRGTSDANALATRSGILIHEALEELNERPEFSIPDKMFSVLVKTLLVHGAEQGEESVNIMSKALNLKGRKSVAKYIGYGFAGHDKSLNTSDSRCTAIGFGEITPNSDHLFSFPIPSSLSGIRCNRKLTVTLAWFSPINPWHRNLRKAALCLVPEVNWKVSALKVKRHEGDYHQVKKGTVQHEVLAGKSKLPIFSGDESLVFRIECRADTTEKLDEKIPIPYGVAVTLEINGLLVPIHAEIRERIGQGIPVKAGAL